MSEILARLQASLQDRYGIQRELGRGGMATVFLATDLKHGREVAIKVLHPELGETIGPERFAREIQVAAKLQHPNILGLFDSGEADGLLYYVMPFIYGESLRDRLTREGLLPVDFAVRTALEVLDALGYAHSMGIVHRDIKPENIMLSGGHALLADFGIARAVTDAGTDQRLTQTGTAVGTPLYMSPEQAVGDPAGPTSDLYSLGCVLYEMLAGTPPFTGPNARAIMARHAMEQVPSVQVVRDTVPDEVEDAIMAALAKVPADRPQTAQQMIEQLQMGLQLTGTAFTATRAAQRRSMARTAQHTAQMRAAQGAMLPDAPPKRNKLLLGGAIGLAVALLGGAGAFFALRGGADAGMATGGLDRHHVAITYFEDLSPKGELSYVADGVTENLIGALGSVPSLSVISKGGVLPFRGGRVPRDSIARALQVGTLVGGSIEPDNDQLVVTIRVYDDAGTELERATFRQPATDLVALADTLAQQAAELIRKRIGAEAQLRRTREGTRNAEAWATYQRAVQARDRGDSLARAGEVPAYQRQYAVAESLGRLAQRLDDRWVDPVVLLGQLDFWRSRRDVGDPGRANLAVDSGLAHTDRALALDRNSSAALELRGTLNYWRWLVPLEADENRRKAIFASARADLEKAVQLNPQAASAYATLSHLYANADDKEGVDVVNAAQKALELDAYLGNADVVMLRLVNGFYDLNQAVNADRWCSEGRRRFPDDYRFLHCRLQLLSTKLVVRPEPAVAWALADSTVALARDPVDQRYEQLITRVLVAGALARAGLVDSAQHVLRAVRPDPEVDSSNDLMLNASYAWLLAGDTTEAMRSLKQYLTTNPGKLPLLQKDPIWWYQGILTDTRYLAVVPPAR